MTAGRGTTRRGTLSCISFGQDQRPLLLALALSLVLASCFFFSSSSRSLRTWPLAAAGSLEIRMLPPLNHSFGSQNAKCVSTRSAPLRDFNLVTLVYPKPPSYVFSGPSTRFLPCSLMSRHRFASLGSSLNLGSVRNATTQESSIRVARTWLVASTSTSPKRSPVSFT